MILSASQEELVRDGYHGATPEVQLHTAPSPLPSPMEPGDVIDFFDSSSGTMVSFFNLLYSNTD